MYEHRGPQERGAKSDNGLGKIRFKRICVGDIETLSSMVTATELSRVIRESGTERRLRFSKVDIQGWAEETTVQRKDIIMKLIELGNGLEGLTSCFTFMDGIVGVMMLIVPECPNGNDRIKNMVNDR